MPTACEEPRLENVTLEISAKPLFQTDNEFVLDLFQRIFRQWHNLLVHSRRVSVLWWLGDGTELLEYDADLSRPIEWAMWLGFAHKTFKLAPQDDPHGESIVGRTRLYRPNPVRITYVDVRRIVGLMKQAAKDVLDVKLDVGCEFDPGSEFCKSPFRYERHRELLLGENMPCIDATARMHADQHAFAGFPDGVLEDTPFGTFFGRQAEHFIRDMDFDYIWLSNSFGFGRSPYASGGAGQFFDGTRYTPEGNREVHDAVLEFWKLFRAECPNVRIECRGTDFTAGMNLVNHATPYLALYAGGFNIVPPPNTPWPMLTDNHGLGLAGYMSQISACREERFPYRFYTSDPWWCNSPWMDVWERSPHDIYLNTAITRIDEDGRVHAFNDVKFLSVDTAWGEVPEQIPNEVMPHICRALDYRPDAVPPVVWIYPFSEYHSYTFEQQDRIAEVMGGDLLIQNALNHALPLSGVITTDAFVTLHDQQPELFSGSVLVTPVPDAGSAVAHALRARLESGGTVLLYGPIAHADPAWLDILGLSLDDPIDGELTLHHADPDSYHESAPPDTCLHDPALSSDGLRAIRLGAADGQTASIAAVSDSEGNERIVALARRNPAWQGGAVAWVRGTSSVSRDGVRGRNLATHDPAEVYQCEALMRHALADLGWDIRVRQPVPSKAARHLMISRCRNGFVFAGHAAGSEVVYALRTPLGAPILPGRDTWLENGAALVRVHTWFHEECRVFVEQQEGTVGLHAVSPKHYRYRRRWILQGLEHATVRFFPETGCMAQTDVLLNPNRQFYTRGDDCERQWCDTPWGRCLELRDVSGELSLAWAPDDAVMPVVPNA
jgi:hypothetical protein